jgi:O-antigen/teichoic acid export membrane protein
VSRVSESLGKLVKGASIVFIGTVIGKAVALFGQILIVRSLSPADYGGIALAFTIVSAVSGIIVLGAPQGATRLIAAGQSSNQKTQTLMTALTISASAGLLGAIAILFFRFRIQQLTDTSGLAKLLSAFSVFLLIAPTQQVLIGGIRGFQQPTARVLSKNIIGQIGALILLGVLLLIGKPYLGAIIYWVSVPILVAISAVYFLQKKVNFSEVYSNKINLTSIGEFLSFSWPLAFSSSFVLLMSQLDVLMIGIFLNTDQVGLYRAIQPLKEVVLFFLTSFTFLYLPIATEFFTDKKYSELNKLYTTVTKWVVTITYPIVLISTFFANDIIRILFTESYLPASTAFVILILGMFTRVIVGPNGTTIQAINKTGVEMYASVIGGIVNIVLNITLISKFGIEGAAVATGMGFITYNIVEIYVIYKETKVTPFSLNIIKPLIPTTAFGIVVSHFFRNQVLGVTVLILVCILFYVCHIASVVATRSIDSSDLLIVEKIDSALGTNLSNKILR